MSKVNKKEPDGKIRVRIPPSPTGPLHVGTAHTALFNYLFARHHGGTSILRFEDTDTARSEKKWEEDILRGLAWLGLDYDEGPNKEGDYGPYHQSARTELYKTYLEKLLKGGLAFYCPHSKEELEQEQKEQGAKKEIQKHVCSSRDRQEASGVIRFKNNGGKIQFTDMIRGEISFEAGLLGDFTIAKNLKEPLYNFAVVVDDETMKITHVIRGEDHISNTPKQLLLQRALGFKEPFYAHLPLILGEDRSKLSKRYGATAVTEYAEAGYLPEAMLNFLALLGWSPKEGLEIMDERTMIEQFMITDVQQSGAIFDIEKLNWMNGMYIRKLALGTLTDLCLPYLLAADLLSVEDEQTYLIVATGIRIRRTDLEKVIGLEQERMRKLSEIKDLTRFFFVDKLQYGKDLLVWKKMSESKLKEALTTLETIVTGTKADDFASAEKLEKHIMPYAEKEKDRGVLLWPLRVSLSGEKASAGPFDLLAVLGKERSLKRIRDAQNLTR